MLSNIYKNSPMNISQQILITAVKNYQKYLSPDHSFWARSLEKPPYCKHIPTCSEYMIEAIEKKGSVV
jgi:putative component of membrane protein insertase Oxa1/YidC/SpoIIIJ protein YidD